MEHTTLYYREGSSDKIYQAGIEPQDGGYIVAFAYGRRGSTLNTGTKTQEPVAYQEAKRLYDKLVKEKTAKGYTPGADGTPYRHTDKEQENTGIQCQLLNPIAEDQPDQLLDDPAYWLQEKFDGRRLLVQKEEGAVTGINRLGLTIGLPLRLIDGAREMAGDFLIDGETVGDTLHAFDMLAFNGQDTRSLAYRDRHLQLMDLIASSSQPAIWFAKTAYDVEQKKTFFAQLKAKNKEGAVFKRIDAPYTSGRPASGGPQLKCKFYETASFLVSRINGKRSVALMLFSGDHVVAAGNVTIPPNMEVPPLNAVVECRYLYALRESGVLYQPVYLGRREDIRPEECVVGQLKYKAEAAKEAA